MKSTLVKQGRVFRFVTEEYQLPDGRTAVLDKVEHPGAVVILPVDNKGELVLVKQYRQAVRETIFEFPAGTLEPGEDPLVCAKRELAEECGKQAEIWKSLGQLLPTPGFCDEVQHCYFATGLSPAVAEMDQDEQLEPLSMPLEDVERLISSSVIKDGKSLAIFLRARLLGLL